ncbi:MAG: DUF4435 domain-containing protein [Microscillaceae bacterium]|jgi:hypothetical protein|nr:DUF4435 domain-containing protein [Microscillaceae bacterium]
MDKIKNYLKPENIIAQARLKRCVMVCTESENDEVFWQTIFAKFAPNLKISFFYPHQTDRGKKLILNLYAQHLQSEFVLCIDSDYDYLLQNSVICQNPFIFQTYANGRENYLCFAERLKNLAMQAGGLEEIDFDFEGFMTEYSKITFELFLYSVYFEKQAQRGFSQAEFNQTIKLSGKIKARFGFQAELSALSQVIEGKIQELKSKYPTTEVVSLKTELQELGLKPENTYLFIDDHTIESITLVALRSAIENGKNEVIKKLRQLYQNDVKAFQQNEAQYRTQFIDIETLMQENEGFDNCFLLQKIQTDIQNFTNLKRL